LLYLADQDLRFKRLGDEIVRAHPGALIFVVPLERSSEHDDRHRTQYGFRPQSGTDLVPILVRHNQIQENEVRALLLRLVDRFLAASRLDEDEPFFAEGQLHDLLDRHTVVGHKNSRGHAILPCKGATRLRFSNSHPYSASFQLGGIGPSWLVR
jgi:hypothetical protein